MRGMECLKLMSNRVVLVIEDDEPKRRAVTGYLHDILESNIGVITAESLSSAIATLGSVEVALAIVDMSIPTFDSVKDRRGGGQPQGFGGADILRFIDSETVVTKSVVLTQYEEFVMPDNSRRSDHRGLEEALRSELDARFFGVIHYTGPHGLWRQSLREVLVKVHLLVEK